jgi:hypothetical protein
MFSIVTVCVLTAGLLAVADPSGPASAKLADSSVTLGSCPWPSVASFCQLGCTSFCVIKMSDETRAHLDE